MKHVLFSLLLLPAAVFAQTPAQPSDSPAQSPKTFVKNLYSDLNKLDAQRVYSKDLFAAIQENAAATPEDEVPYLNFNPLCACQDGKVSLRKVTRVNLANPSQFEESMRVSYTLTGQGKKTLTLKLIPKGKMWAVDDVVYPDSGSLKQGLKQDTARQKKESSARP